MCYAAIQSDSGFAGAGWLDVNTSENNSSVLREQAHLLDLMLDAIILRDMQGVIIFWNHGAEKLFGWTSDEALGKHANTLLHTQLPQPLEVIEAEALRAGHWEGELVHTRRDGTPLVVTSRWAVWQQDRGAPLAIVEISTDITERKQVERSQRLLGEAGPVLAASLDATTRLANIAQGNDTGLPVVGAVGQSTTEKRACHLHRNQASTARLHRANRLYYECTALSLSGRSATPQERRTSSWQRATDIVS